MEFIYGANSGQYSFAVKHEGHKATMEIMRGGSVVKVVSFPRLKNLEEERIKAEKLFHELIKH